ncbi:Nucleoside ABC transporter, permease protein 2 [Olavius algarvensis associated proteobacterium Delta 3]|nr:Nucleoside ABC transporter, permease protein 2 [Olavius algarvensis associated proteobacterium Delta 3]
MTSEMLILLMAATIQSGTPILYATLGEIITEKSGVLNLGVEGIVMVGALAGFLAAKITGSPVAGVLAGGLCGSLLAGVHGLVCLGFQGNQVVSGLALTILGTALANYLGTPYVGQNAPGFYPVPLPVLSQVPVLGPIFFRHDLLVYGSFVAPALIWIFMKYSRWGLGLRTAGENPEAGAAAGIPVVGYRWAGILAGGFLMGIGGAYLSLAYTHIWTTGLSAGRGWIAVALVIFAFWKPGRAVVGAYLFGGVMAFQLRLQAMGANIPSSLLLMLPYGLTVVVLTLASMRQRGDQAPAVLGVNLEPRD